MYNKVILVGRLGKDPEVTQFDNGNKVANFSLATSESYKDKNGEWQTNTEWHRVVAWGNLAGQVQNGYQKGDSVIVEGKVTHRSYEQNNETKHITEIVANKLRLAQKSNTGDQQGNYRQNQPRNTQQQYQEPAGAWEDNGSVPF